MFGRGAFTIPEAIIWYLCRMSVWGGGERGNKGREWERSNTLFYGLEVLLGRGLGRHRSSGRLFMLRYWEGPWGDEGLTSAHECHSYAPAMGDSLKSSDEVSSLEIL